MQSSFLVQAMDLAAMEGDTLMLNFYQGFGTTFVQPAEIVVQGIEQVSVPAGDFDAYRVHIFYGGAEADLYVEVDGEGRLLRHDVPGRNGVLSTVLIPEPVPEEGSEPENNE